MEDDLGSIAREKSAFRHDLSPLFVFAGLVSVAEDGGSVGHGEGEAGVVKRQTHNFEFCCASRDY